jgi:hypothetical protein
MGVPQSQRESRCVDDPSEILLKAENARVELEVGGAGEIRAVLGAVAVTAFPGQVFEVRSPSRGQAILAPPKARAKGFRQHERNRVA